MTDWKSSSPVFLIEIFPKRQWRTTFLDSFHTLRGDRVWKIFGLVDARLLVKSCGVKNELAK